MISRYSYRPTIRRYKVVKGHPNHGECIVEAYNGNRRVAVYKGSFDQKTGVWTMFPWDRRLWTIRPHGMFHLKASQVECPEPQKTESQEPPERPEQLKIK